MNKAKLKRTAYRSLNRINSVLPVFFWAFLIFGFEEPRIAIASILSALLHEGGHILYVMTRHGRVDLRGVISGFRIKKRTLTTYKEELMTYLSGPLANLVCFTLLSLLAPLVGDWAWEMALINLVTALSNLLPIDGYDGYGILRCIVMTVGRGEHLLFLIRKVSTALTFLFCILSLYLIDRLGGGYWIFAVFFISTIKCIRDDLDK